MTSRQPPANDGPLAPVPREEEGASATMYSRPMDSSPYGKSTVSVEISMPEALKALLSRLGALDEKSVSAYCRKVLEDHALREEKRIGRILTVFGGDAYPENRR